MLPVVFVSQLLTIMSPNILGNLTFVDFLKPLMVSSRKPVFPLQIRLRTSGTMPISILTVI